MQNTSPNRKRPAPGASPMMQQPIQQNPYQYPMPDNNDFTNFDFSNPLPGDQTFSQPSAFDSNDFSYNLNAAQPPTYGGNLNAQPSTELVRRARNQQLAPQNGQQELWNGVNNMTGQYDDEDEAELERKVADAKKDAQGKRKQIPPFVQKLSR
jgi:heat shock transcription factor